MTPTTLDEAAALMQSPENRESLAMLLKVIQRDGFKLIVVEHNHAGFARALFSELKHRYPDKPLYALKATGKDYRQFSDALNDIAQGVVIIPDFDWLLAKGNESMCIAFNQRRDHFAKKPMVLVLFVASSLSKRLSHKMPDWWSLRSLEVVFNRPPETGALIEQGYLGSEIDQSSIQGKDLALAGLYRQLEETAPENKVLQNLLHQEIGRIGLETGAYQQAAEHFQKCLAISEALDDQNAQADGIDLLGQAYYHLGQYEASEPLYQKAMEIRKKLLGEAHPSLATSYNNLAGLYKAQGKYEEAEPLYQKDIEITKKVLGEAHPSLATSYNNLAGLYRAQGKYEEAEPLYQKSMEIMKKVLGEAHPSLATSYNNLAELYRAQGKYEAAEPLFQKAIDIKKKVLGEAHPDLALIYNNLAMLYRAQGKYEEAEALYQKALIIMKKSLGEKHPNTQTVMRNLERFLAEKNR